MRLLFIYIAAFFWMWTDVIMIIMDTSQREVPKVDEYITHNVLVNGLEVNARYNYETVDNILIPLLQKLTKMQAAKKSRVLALFAAPPGTGKSTLLSFLERLAAERDDIGDVQIIGMDGFHMRQAYLTSHTIIRDGEEISMARIKGAPETFDLKALTDRIAGIAAGENCGWPIYDRRLHDPVDNAITVTGDIVLLEGNYLLLDLDGWRDLRKYADYTVLIRADEEKLRGRLTERKARGMSSYEEAERFVEFSDLRNVRTCLACSSGADLVLEMVSDGNLIVVKD